LPRGPQAAQQITLQEEDSRKVGTETSTAAAITMPQCTPVCSTKLARPTGSVNILRSVWRMNANVKSFQESAKEKMPTDRMPGRAEGRHTWRRAARRLAPEVHAASSSDSGTIWKYCHMSQMLSGRLMAMWARIRPV